MPSLLSSSHNPTWPLWQQQPWWYGCLLAEWCLCFPTHCWICHSFPAKKRSSSYLMASVTIRSGFRAQEEEISHCFQLFPFCLPWSKGNRCHDLSFFILFLIFSFKLAFSLSSFTPIKRFFSSSSFSATRVLWLANLRLLIFLPAIYISACNSSSPALLIMWSAYKLNMVTTDSPVILLSQSWTNQLFHTGFWLLLLDQNTGFSGDR